MKLGMMRKEITDSRSEPRLNKSTLSNSGAVRSLIIAYGIGAYAFLQHHLVSPAQLGPPPSQENSLTMIVMGLALQAVRWTLLWALSRYERNNEQEGILSPTIKYSVDLTFDGVTVLLFALGTFRGIVAITASV